MNITKVDYKKPKKMQNIENYDNTKYKKEIQLKKNNLSSLVLPGNVLRKY